MTFLGAKKKLSLREKMKKDGFLMVSQALAFSDNMFAYLENYSARPVIRRGYQMFPRTKSEGGKSPKKKYLGTNKSKVYFWCITKSGFF